MIQSINIENEFDSILKLYSDARWITYTEKKDHLKQALINSTYVYGYYCNEQLIGIIRGLTDKEFIHYIQDIIVHSKFKNKGIGSLLISHIKSEYKEVRTHLLMTDDHSEQIKFYEKNKFTNTKKIKKFPINCFVIFN